MQLAEKVFASMGMLIFLYLVSKNASATNNFLNALGNAVNSNIQVLQGNS